MDISASQIESLFNSLLSAFPTSSDLRQMVRFQLDENMAAIIDGENQTDRVLTLIEWAESRGRLSDLISGASRANPENLELRKWIQAHASHLSLNVTTTQIYENLDIKHRVPSEELLNQAKKIREQLLNVFEKCKENRLDEAILLIADGHNGHPRIKEEFNTALQYLLDVWSINPGVEVARLLLDYMVCTTYVAEFIWFPRERIRYLTVAISAAEFLKNSKVQRGLYLNLANSHWENSDITQARRLYLTVLDRHDKSFWTLNSLELCAAYNGLGCCAIAEGRFDTGIQHFESVKRFAEDDSRSRIQLGNAYCSIGDTYIRQGKISQALNSYKLGLNIAKQEKDVSLLIRLSAGYGNAYLRQGSISAAGEHYEQGIELATQIGGSVLTSVIHLNRALTLSAMDDNELDESIRSKLLEYQSRLNSIIESRTNLV